MDIEIIKRRKKKIEDLLIELNFNIGSKGFEYWVQAIMLYKYDFKSVRQMMERIYEKIADNNKDTVSRVERAMRTAKKTATVYIADKYKYNVRLTNRRLIKLLGESVKYE